MGAASNVLSTSADVSWDCTSCTSGGTQMLEYGLAGFVPGTGTLMNPAASPVSITGLTSGTDYEALIWLDCGGGDQSDTILVSFSTSPGCGDDWFDNGGSTGLYLASSDQVTTFCPDVMGESVLVTFNLFDTENNFDGLFVFDGPDTMLVNSPLIPGPTGTGSTTNDLGIFQGIHGGNSFTGAITIGPFVSSHPSGCLTFHFVSDGSVQDIGWDADVTCGTTNFTCANAETVNCGDFVSGIVTGSNSLPATACSFNGGASTGGTWYVFTGTGDDLTASTCGFSSFDSRISVFEAAPDCSNLLCIAGVMI